MRIINHQKPIVVTFKGPEGEVEEEITFRKFLVQHLDNMEGVKSVKMLKQLSKIVGIVEEGGDTLMLEDADYDVLQDALKTPRFIPRVGRQLLGFWDAVEVAETVKAPGKA